MCDQKHDMFQIENGQSIQTRVDFRRIFYDTFEIKMCHILKWNRNDFSISEIREMMGWKPKTQGFYSWNSLGNGNLPNSALLKCNKMIAMPETHSTFVHFNTF